MKGDKCCEERMDAIWRALPRVLTDPDRRPRPRKTGRVSSPPVLAALGSLQAKVAHHELVHDAEIFNAVSDPEVLTYSLLTILNRRSSLTPGVDRVTRSQFHRNGRLVYDAIDKRVSELSHSIRSGNWKPNPVRRISIPSKGKTRNLGIPTLNDRAVHSAIATVLGILLDPIFAPTSFGFRPNRGTRSASRWICDWVNSRPAGVFAATLDIKACFDNVVHVQMVQAVERHIHGDVNNRFVSLIRRILRAPISVNGILTKSRLGLVQGGPASPVLLNTYLNHLDHLIVSNFDQESAVLVRYADDLLVLATEPQLVTEVIGVVHRELTKLKLTLKNEKPEILPATDFEWLGYNFRHTAGKLDPWIPLKAVDKRVESIMDLIARIHEQSLDSHLADIAISLYQSLRGWSSMYAGLPNYFTCTTMLQDRLEPLLFDRYKSDIRTLALIRAVDRSLPACVIEYGLLQPGVTSLSVTETTLPP